MGKTEKQLPTLLNKLRWIMSMLIAVLSVGYILFEDIFSTSPPIDLAYTLSEAIIIGTLGFTLTWILLTWVIHIARSRQQVIKALKWRVLQLEIAGQVSQKITSILDVDELLPQIVKLVQDKFGYYHVHLFLVDKQSNEIVLRECSGPADKPMKAQGLCFKIGDRSITSWVVQTGQPVLCNDITQDSRYQPHKLLPKTRSELTVPGVGFDSKRVLTEAPGQMGLIGMKERAQSIGGQLEVRSSLGSGAKIELDVPLPTNSTPRSGLLEKEGEQG
ncbi:MAG: GAF domain-containing protein [Gammaproteobacteria bacterium]|nr:GAF domain-containing protein [Gammaproteobacteria bacterium]